MSFWPNDCWQHELSPAVIHGFLIVCPRPAILPPELPKEPTYPSLFQVCLCLGKTLSKTLMLLPQFL